MNLTRVSARAAACLPTLAALLATALPPLTSARAAESVNIYSYREPQLVEPLLKAFTDKTGVKVNLIYAKEGLVERLAAEGKNSPADALLTNEFAFLTQAAAHGLTQPVRSATVEAAIPASLRDPNGHWIGLTQRARVVYASKERVTETAVTLEELAGPKWKGRICMRSGQYTYNIALIAGMIAHLGEAKAEAWLAGLKNNLARKPAGGDREAVRDVQAGLCDIAIANTYYMGAMLKNPEQKAWAEAVRIIFPDAEGRGTHVNISGIAVTANAPNKANAVKLVEFLAGPEAQKFYAEVLNEYPAAVGVEPSPLVASWGKLKPDALPLARIAELRRKASELVDKVRFDGGPGS